MTHVTITDDGWIGREYSVIVYRCPVYLRPDGGGFSAVAPLLPSVAGQGGTLTEALANVTEAISAALREYRAGGAAVPWRAAARELEPGEWRCWVFVDVGRTGPCR